ncbi:MAG TPA: nucleotide exchange factor GrpE [Thermomicrobiales bacterium]|nr:nucleotide exchange factor GrpE [Thermomicrobiales bacterium]
MTEANRDATRMNGEAPGAAADEQAPPAAAIDAQKLAEERDSYLDQLQRCRADYANLRRRTEQERAQLREQANARLIHDLLPVLDDLQDGLAHAPQSDDAEAFVNGMRLVEQKFRRVLERAGATPIEAAGEPFNPTLHDAVDVDAAGGNVVTDVYRQGYRLGQSVLRPAAVKVGPGKGGNGEAS